MSQMDSALEKRASELFHQGQYEEALMLYTTIYDRLPSGGATRRAVGILLSRSACHLKLKQFQKVLEDCNRVLELDADNVKAMGRKTKVLCSLGRFVEAHHVAGEWKLKDPQSEQAKKEYQLLEMIIKTLSDQDGDVCIESPLTTSGLDYGEGQKVTAADGNKVILESSQTKTANDHHNKMPTTGCEDTKVSDDMETHASSMNTSCDQQLPTTNTVLNEVISPAPDGASPQTGVQSESEHNLGTNNSYANCSVNSDNVQHSASHHQSNQQKDDVDREGKETWKFRPPPRGLTDKEYSLCPKFSSLGSCQYGSLCTQAHSIDELAEWCERFVAKKNHLKHAQEEGTCQRYELAEAILEKLMSTEDPETVMKEDIDGINVHMNSDQKIHLTSKKTSHFWMFTITTRLSLKHVILLDNTNRKHFSIYSITIGPKRLQTPQQVESDCQEWTNSNYREGRSANEHVYRVKVLFSTAIYGTFRQSVVFDFGEEPVLVKELCIDSVPITEIQMLKESLIVQEGKRWDLSKLDIVEFDPNPLPHDEMENALLKKYPPPFGTRFIPSPSLLNPSLTRENYKQRMHSMLELEEMAWFSSIAKFNVKARLKIVDRFMLMPSSRSEAKFAHKGELYAYLKLNGTLSEDTAHGRLILQNVNTVYLAPQLKHHHSSGNSNNSSSSNRNSSSSESSDSGSGSSSDSGSSSSTGSSGSGSSSSANIGSNSNDQRNEKQPNRVYEALIEEKGKNFMFIRLSVNCVSELSLKKDTETTAEIQFHLNRLPICQMHMALDELCDMEFIFPTLSNNTNIPWTPQKLWKENLDPRLNAKQKEAIIAIATDLSIKLPPILIVGPYGTGKTFTLAQATKEVLSQENTRILICTHSNSAADLYIKDYLHPYVENNHPEAIPLRVYYRHRWIETVHPTVKQYCLIASASQRNGMSGSSSAFRHPTLEDLENVRVVVTTLSMSQYLCVDGVHPGFFTHIFIDEAAQVMECESLLPLRLAGPQTRLVLAGDHMQMGPEIHSEFAREHNFHVSLLERLYESYPNQHPCKIQLCENYRSHQAIIDFTSELFYDSKLVASGNQPKHDQFYPLTFFAARGEEVQHKNSTAFFNSAEVYEIVERVSELVKSWPKSWGDVDESSIGVVSAYPDQVQRIRAELRKRKLVNVSVERVLNIQGKQFRVIFLSTVRTQHSCNADPSLEDELDYGFLSNIKLLNTAITRAQSMVAAVGDPVSLSSIGKCRKIWERFLEICANNGSLYGMSWAHIRAELDGVELKKVYVLNPLAPEFIPNRLRHGPVAPPELVAYGKYGYMFLTRPRSVVVPSGGHINSRWSRSAVLQTCLQSSVDKTFSVYAPVNSVGSLPSYGLPTAAVPASPARRHPEQSNLAMPNAVTHTQTTTEQSTDRGHGTPTSSKSLATPGPISSPQAECSNEMGVPSVQGSSLLGNGVQNVIGAPVYMQNLTQSCTGNPVFMQGPSPLADTRIYPNTAHCQQPVLPINMYYLPQQFASKRPVPVSFAAYTGQPVYSMTTRPIYPPYAIHPVPYVCPVMPVPLPYQTLAGPVIGPRAHQFQGCKLNYQHPGLLQNLDSPALSSSANHLSVPEHCVSSTNSTASNSSGATVKQTNGLHSDNGRLDAVLSGMGTEFFRKLWLSQELYTYITETEGEMAAVEFIHKLQQGDFYKKKSRNNRSVETKCSDIDIEDSSIIAMAKTSASQTLCNNSVECDVHTADNESPMLMKEQREKLIEATYELTVSQAQQFTGPYSLQKQAVITKENERKMKSEGSSTPSPSQAESGNLAEETCQVADSIIRFLEDSQDEQSLRSELLALSNPSASYSGSSGSQSHPLYLRKCTKTNSDQSTDKSEPPSYASILQKAPVPKSNVPGTKSSTASPVTDSKHTSCSHDTIQSSTTTGMPPDPLDILRNLNIKASPSTQALFDYFA